MHAFLAYILKNRKSHSFPPEMEKRIERRGRARGRRKEGVLGKEEKRNSGGKQRIGVREGLFECKELHMARSSFWRICIASYVMM